MQTKNCNNLKKAKKEGNGEIPVDKNVKPIFFRKLNFENQLITNCEYLDKSYIFPLSNSTQRPVIVNILRNLIVQKYREILHIPVQVELSSTKIVLNKEPAEQQPVVEKERHESEKVTFTRFVWNQTCKKRKK